MRRMNDELAALLSEGGFAFVQQAVGVDARAPAIAAASAGRWCMCIVFSPRSSLACF